MDKASAKPPAPMIGITTYPVNPNADKQNRSECGYNTPREYVMGVVRAGGVPVLLPPIGAEPAELWLERIDGLVLIGGGDIHPEYYKESPHPTLYNIDPIRDASEIALILGMMKRKMPCLAICRGMQLINVVLGGSLHQHLPDCGITVIEHRNDTSGPSDHDITLNPHSRLAAIMGSAVLPQSQSPNIVSWHHQAVKALGKNAKQVATSSDGIIEAIEFDNHPDLIAVQWHPELSAEKDDTQQNLFNYLVRSSAAYRHQTAFAHSR